MLTKEDLEWKLLRICSVPVIYGGAIIALFVIWLVDAMVEYNRTVTKVTANREAAERYGSGETDPLTIEKQKRLRLQPVKITIVPYQITARLALARVHSKQEQLHGLAAPFILCSLVERYPAQKQRYRNKELRVEWDYEIEYMSQGTCWLAYERKTHSLFETCTGPGGGHGTQYLGVTDELLLKLYRNAIRYKTTINLNRLRRFGCRTESY